MEREELESMRRLIENGEPLSSTAAQFGLTPGEASELLAGDDGPLSEVSPGKVRVSQEGVDAFRARWPGARLRSRSYWFEYDSRGDLVDTDVPEHDDGPDSAAMADDCRAWLFDDETPEWA